MNKFLTVFAVLVLLITGARLNFADDTSVFVTSHPKGPLGIMVTDVDKEKLAQLGIAGGAEIDEVFAGSEAEKQGLQEGDIITAVEDKTVASPEDLAEQIAEIKKEKDVTLTYIRDGNKKTVAVHIKPVKGNFLFYSDNGDFSICLPEGPLTTGSCIMPNFGCCGGKGGYLGVEAKNLSDQMQEYFEVKLGVLVEKVEQESPAEKAGIKAGDVILSISKREINDFGDLVRTLNYYNPGEKVTIEISRKGKKNTLDVTLGEKKGDHLIHRKIIKGIDPFNKMDLPHNPDRPGVKKQIKIIKDGEDGGKTILRFLSI